MNLKQLALEIAEQAHAGQFDKGGTPYINHPQAVAANFDDEYRYAAALLHDVVEDTPITLEELQSRGVPVPVVEAVAVLTKRKGEPYRAYLERLKANPIARDVKKADLQHNCQLSRIPNPTTKDYSRLEKYKDAVTFLAG